MGSCLLLRVHDLVQLLNFLTKILNQVIVVYASAIVESFLLHRSSGSPQCFLFRGGSGPALESLQQLCVVSQRCIYVNAISIQLQTLGLLTRELNKSVHELSACDQGLLLLGCS